MPVGLVRRNSPLIVTLPYTGVNMPRILFERLQDNTRFFSAPDRFLARLLDGRAEGVNVLQANFHRYVSDVDYLSHRNESGPRKGMMGMVPIIDRDGSSIWTDPPGMKEAASWRAMYFAPFHAALAAQLARVRAQFGHAVILNIRAHHPSRDAAAEAAAPQMGFGTGRGASCGADLTVRLKNLLRACDDVHVDIDTTVQQGRITHHYGRPSACSHAIDLDIDEGCYLNATDDVVLYDPQRAAPVTGVLREVIDLLDDWRPS